MQNRFYWRHQRFLLARPHWGFRFWCIYRFLVFHPKIWKMIICQSINLLQHCRQLLESLSQGVKSHKLCFYSGLSGWLPCWKHWLPDIPWKIEASFTAFRCGCGVTVTWSICQVKEPPADSKQPVGKMPFMRSSIVSVHSFPALLHVRLIQPAAYNQKFCWSNCRRLQITSHIWK